jgi:hypothetical protein
MSCSISARDPWRSIGNLVLRISLCSVTNCKWSYTRCIVFRTVDESGGVSDGGESDERSERVERKIEVSLNPN